MKTENLHPKILVTAIGSMSAENVLCRLKDNFHATLFGCDIYPQEWLANASLTDLFFQVPKADSPSYLSILCELIRQYSIDFIIPLTDPEVDVLSANRTLLESSGSRLCLSTSETISLCRDKYQVFKLFENDSCIKPIPSRLVNELAGSDFPVLAKPKNGRSSEHQFHISCPELIPLLFSMPDDYIFQPFLQGDIFTVDYVRDRYGNDQAIVRRELLRTANGAGIVVEIIPDSILLSQASYIGAKTNILGCVNFEFLFDGETYFLMDINPRFSAGVSFSFQAGYDMVSNHLACFMAQKISYDQNISSVILGKQFKDFTT